VTSGQGQPKRAARLFGAVAAVYEGLGDQSMVHQRELERDVAAARAQLDEATWAAAWAAGRAMTLEQAIVYALEKNGDVGIGGRLVATGTNPRP
jgi:hypothetical protein